MFSKGFRFGVIGRGTLILGVFVAVVSSSALADSWSLVSGVAAGACSVSPVSASSGYMSIPEQTCSVNLNSQYAMSGMFAARTGYGSVGASAASINLPDSLVSGIARASADVWDPVVLTGGSGAATIVVHYHVDGSTSCEAPGQDSSQDCYVLFQGSLTQRNGNSDPTNAGTYYGFNNEYTLAGGSNNVSVDFSTTIPFATFGHEYYLHEHIAVTAWFGNSVSFLNTGSITGVSIFDDAGHPVDGAQLLFVNPDGSTQPFFQSSAQVPEPISLVLFGSGLCGLATVIRRRKMHDQ